MPAQLKRRLTVFLVAVGLIALAFFLHWWFIGRHVESTNNAYVQGEITRVASQLGARVEEVLVRDNQHVDKGSYWYAWKTPTSSSPSSAPRPRWPPARRNWPRRAASWCSRAA